MTGKQETFVKEYVENNGNAAEAYKKAYPKCKIGHRQHGYRTVTLGYIQEAIVKLKKEVEAWKEGGRELCDKLFSERYEACVAKNDNTNAIRCIENKAKNVGYYALDNEQRAEKRELDAETLKHRRLIAFAVLTMEPEAIQEALQEPKEVKSGNNR